MPVCGTHLRGAATNVDDDEVSALESAGCRGGADVTTALYRTRITHLRRAPVHHYFEHRSYSWFVDVDALPGSPAGCVRLRRSTPATICGVPIRTRCAPASSRS